MSKQELERVLRALAQAENDDVALHTGPSTLQERVESHNRLNRLRAEVARLSKTSTRSVPKSRRSDKGLRLFPRGG